MSTPNQWNETYAENNKPKHMFVNGEPVCIQGMWDAIDETKKASKNFWDVIVITWAKVRELCSEKVIPAFVPQEIETKFNDKKLEAFKRLDKLFLEEYKDPSNYHIVLELCLWAIRELSTYTESTKVNKLLTKWQIRRALITIEHSS